MRRNIYFSKLNKGWVRNYLLTSDPKGALVCKAIATFLEEAGLIGEAHSRYVHNLVDKREAAAGR